MLAGLSRNAINAATSTLDSIISQCSVTYAVDIFAMGSGADHEKYALQVWRTVLHAYKGFSCVPCHVDPRLSIPLMVCDMRTTVSLMIVGLIDLMN